MNQTKTYVVTYKVYHNKRIKQVSFHGKLIWPLYIQMTFDRKTTVYKCNLFDLYLKPKYSIRVAGEVFPPHIDDIVTREEKLIAWVIDKNPDNFSLELFKREYNYYSKDLLDEMEPTFLDYLNTFFHDEGMPSLADALMGGSPERSLATVVRDMKMALKPDLYGKLLENSFSYAPPYLPLYQFAEKLIQGSLTSLTIMNWEDAKTKEEFWSFMTTHYPENDVFKIMNEINEWTKQLRSI